MTRLNSSLIVLSAAALLSAVPSGRASAQNNPKEQGAPPRETAVAVRGERGAPAPAPPPSAGGGGNARTAEPRGGGMPPPPNVYSGGGGNGGAQPPAGGPRPYGASGRFEDSRETRSDKTAARDVSAWLPRPRGNNPATGPSAGPSTVRLVPAGGTRGQGPGGARGQGPGGVRGQGPGEGRGGSPQSGQHYFSGRGYRGPYGSNGHYGWNIPPFGWGIFGFGYLNLYDPFWWSYGGYPGYDYGYAYDDQGWYDVSAGSEYPPPQFVMGSIRLKIKPAQASVYVDGYYAGRVDDFDNMFQKLRLDPGPHRIEVSAPGFKSIALEVNIRSGETLNFQAQLEIVR